MPTPEHLAHVAIPVPLPRLFTYRIPASLRAVDALAPLVPGMRVACPFGPRTVVGVVVSVEDGEAPRGARAISAVLDTAPAIDGELLSFLVELAKYYWASPGEVMRLALPPMDRATADAVAAPTGTQVLFAPERGRGGPRGIAERKQTWVHLRGDADGAALAQIRSKVARAILADLGDGPLALKSLVVRYPSARAVTKKLEAAGFVRAESRDEAPASAFAFAVARDVAPILTEAQVEATGAITRAIAAAAPATFLLHGITGSGKTEVYLHAIAAARACGRGAVVLVPEIALTPQLVSRFRARFGDRLGVLHSGLTPRDRLAMWRRLRSGEFDVAIGARSALFAPVSHLGLLVVDEEHDPSFKQEDGVRYHARDMAILRAHRAGAVVVLGSATPSLESERLVRTKKAARLSLPARARDTARLPSVQIIDLRRTGAGPTGDKRLSLPLHRAIEKTLAAREQTILFLNRRGFAPSVRCMACGTAMECPSCSIALTFHRRGRGEVRCHYCEYRVEYSGECGQCRSRDVMFEGLGTEKLEDVLAEAFPSARVARLDRDVAGGAGGANVEAILSRVRAREVDILVGTQMVTKGHDLPGVTLVGVINADAALSMPDFRSAERAFHLLVQVAGRAGRGDRPGHVLVQTYDPEHPSIAFAARHDVVGFLERELVDREELGYPPFSRLALVKLDDPDEAVVAAAAAHLGEVARAAAARAPSPGRAEVLGPSAAPLARLRGRFRYRLLLRAAGRAEIRAVLAALEPAIGKLPRTVRVAIDVDPMQML